LKEPDNNLAKGKFWCLVTSRSVVVVAAQALEQYFFTLRCMKSYISIKKNYQIALFLSFLSLFFKWCYFCCRITLLLFEKCIKILKAIRIVGVTTFILVNRYVTLLTLTIRIKILQKMTIL